MKEDIIATEKALAAAFKDIGNAFNMLGAGPALEPQREYSMVKSNYFYDKAGEDVEEWLVKIDCMLEANNVANRRKITVVVAHLRDAAADWFEADKVNINQYTNNNARSFIRWIKT